MPTSRNKLGAKGSGKLGRPKHSTDADLERDNTLIARAVYVLDGWGFVLMPGGAGPSPRGALECVAYAAKSVLKRKDSSGQPLSHKRVEQLYRSWWRTEYDRWHRNTLVDPPDPNVPTTPPVDWSRFTRESRRRRVPGSLARLPLADIAMHLLLHDGSWATAAEEEAITLATGYTGPAPELTPRTLQRELVYPMPARLRKTIEAGLAPRPRGRKRRNRPVK